jgi:sec-independent protein translocase protein TatC
MQPFNICLKAAFLGGAVISSPFLIYQVWCFIFPALTDKEKNVVRGLFVTALFFFFIGMSLAYYLIIPMGAEVLIGYKTDAMIPLIGIEDTINFVVFFLLALGIVFETPLVMMGLAKAGIVNVRMLAKNRKFAVLGSVILACIVTPGSEVLTSAILAIPLYLLFELSLILMRFVEPKRTKEDILREKQEELDQEAYDDDDDE